MVLGDIKDIEVLFLQKVLYDDFMTLVWLTGSQLAYWSVKKFFLLFHALFCISINIITELKMRFLIIEPANIEFIECELYRTCFCVVLQGMDTETTAVPPVCWSLRGTWRKACRPNLLHTWTWTTANQTCAFSSPPDPRTPCPPS